MSLQTGLPLARLADPIVDPRKLVVPAFRVVGTRLSHSVSVLHTEDIREIGEFGVIVDSDEKLMPLDDLVRLQQVIDFGFELIGLKVVTISGKKLGRVGSYALDLEVFQVQQIYVQPNWRQSLLNDQLTIHRSQIVAITNKLLTVKDTKTPVKKPVPAAATTAFVNPFRQPSSEGGASASTSRMSS